MSFKLNLTAPRDMAIGELKIVQQAADATEWVALSGTSRQFEHLHPGICQVQITPTGGTAQIVIFSLSEEDYSLTLPDYSVLAANGGNLHWLDKDGTIIQRLPPGFRLPYAAGNSGQQRATAAE